MAKFDEYTGALSNSAFTLPAKNRNGIVVGNSGSGYMMVRFGATATATAGIPLEPNGSLYLTMRDAPSDSVSIFSAGTANYTVYEW